MADSHRREVVLGFESKLMCVANAIMPSLIDWILARTLTRRGD